MRQKVLHKSSCPQPGTKTGLGELQNVEAGNQTGSSGLHPAPAHQTGKMCRCSARNDQTAEKARHVSELGFVSRAAIVLPLLAIRLYQIFLSPFLGRNCRFEPSCSHYAQDAFRTHGFFRGMYLTIYRILRCNPWCKAGYDPVPPRAEKRKQHKK